MSIQGKIMVVDDDPNICALLSDNLTEEGHQVQAANNGKDALKRIKQEEFDVIITDLEMRGMNGLELIQRIKNIRPEAITLIITAFGTIESAVEAIKLGAFHYISKPFQLSEVSSMVEKALHEKNLRNELSRLRKEEEICFSFGHLIGKSKPMHDVFQLIRRVALFSSTVLIVGESGTGKELVAKAIHYNSPRKENRFVTINCAAIPENLLESELFGHMKGSFTGAQSDHGGLFEEAHGGSLFLDEIAEMPMSLQVKLLRAIQEKEVRRVGSTKNTSIDVRIIAATNRDLQARVKAGAFREDLYYRLNVITINIPPLRERREDIHLLAYYFLKIFAQSTHKEIEEISMEAMRLLLQFDWPGNVRELENVLERAVILADQRSIIPSYLPGYLNRLGVIDSEILTDHEDDLISMEEIERRHILKVMEITQWNKHLAAQILGIDRSTLYRKLEHFTSVKPLKTFTN